MKKLCFCFLICFLGMRATAAQQRKAAPVIGTTAARICADPYAVAGPADGWPEAPLTVLFHREKSKAPWTHNPAVKAAGLEATSPGNARTVACIEESLDEVGKYDNGLSAYQPAWRVTLVRLADRKVYFSSTSFDGEKPPALMMIRGENIGKRPIETVVRWLRLIAEQKVAKFKMRLRAKDSEEVSALAFSADDNKLVMAQEARSTSSGTPPSPITVFDLSDGKITATLVPNVFARHVDISKSGRLIAADGYRHVEIWDLSVGKVIHKLEAPQIQSLSFGPDDTLAVAGEGQAALWDIANEHKLRSASGSYITLSPGGTWLVAKNEATGITVQELESGRVTATFPALSSSDTWAITNDGKALGRFSLTSSASMYLAGDTHARVLTIPSIRVGLMYGLAPMRDGFAVANGEGIIGIASASSPEPRVFATDQIGIRIVAVSGDGKLLAAGDMFGGITIWELR